MSNLIDRQAAIDALMEKDKNLININWYGNPYAEGECGGIDEALSIISNLPSAQPEITHEQAIEHLQKSGWMQNHDKQMYEMGLSDDERRRMSNLIDRQAEIDAVTSLCDDCDSGYCGSCRVDYPEEKDCRKVLEDLPSAQPEPIRINLNEPIKVKLTDLGKEIYYHQYDRINQIAGREICKPKFPKEDENGYTKFQLWCFIELYGEHMGMTTPNVIKPLEIVYERRG